jgi:arylsulfatase A-like enzyme
VIGAPPALSGSRVPWVCIGAALLLACSSSSVPSAAPANLVLIVIDTLRADHVGAYGYERDTSPELDALAARGMRFARVSAPSSWTKPSVASLFTSRLPSEHGAVAFLSSLSPDVETVAELLGRAGYRCLGVSSNFAHVNKQSGLARGFHAWSTLETRVYDESADFFVEQPDGSPTRKLRAVSAQEVNRELLRLLDSEPSRPVFLYVHYMEPHPGYAPPPELSARFVRDPEFARNAPPATARYLNELAAGRTSLDEAGRLHLIDLYDAEIAAADRGLGQLLEALRGRGFDENTVTIVTSDHGEEFRDHGGWFHGLTLYEEALSVPLVVYDSRHPRGGEVYEDEVDSLDVPTTLLAVAGVEPSPGMRGHDLLRPEALEADRERFAELQPTGVASVIRPRAHAWAYVRWPWKVVRVPGAELEVFDLDRDPLERESIEALAPSVPPAVLERATAWARAAALARIKRNRGRRAPEAELDQERREELWALGYLE